MKNRISWKEKYFLALQERLTLHDIMLLRDCGMPKARHLREKALEYCILNDIEIEAKTIPTEAIFVITRCDLQFYFDKMNCELTAFGLSERKE